jgi:hypothetical protein
MQQRMHPQKKILILIEKWTQLSRAKETCNKVYLKIKKSIMECHYYPLDSILHRTSQSTHIVLAAVAIKLCNLIKKECDKFTTTYKLQKWWALPLSSQKK